MGSLADFTSYYRDFKQEITTTNHNNPERDLLLHSSFEMTVRCLLGDGFASSEPDLTAQMKRLFKNMPAFFKPLLPRSEQVSVDDADTFETISDASHLQAAVSHKIKGPYCKATLGLPIRGSQIVAGSAFSQALIAAYTRDYEISINKFSGPTQWFKKISFTDP